MSHALQMEIIDPYWSFSGAFVKNINKHSLLV